MHDERQISLAFSYRYIIYRDFARTTITFFYTIAPYPSAGKFDYTWCALGPVGIGSKNQSAGSFQ